MGSMTKKLIALLGSNDLELRAAAIRVITEMGLSTKPVIQAVAKCLREPYEELQVTALKGLTRLGARDVASTVVPLVLASGSLREHAMAVVTAIGPSVVSRLENLYDQADFHGKRAIITALARIGGKNALAFLLKVLPGEPFELQKHLTYNICEALDRIKPPQQTPIFTPVAKLVKHKAAARNPQVTIAGLIMLGHFKGQALAARARTLLRAYAEKKLPPEVRRYALVSLNRLVLEAKTTPDYVRFVMKMLCDEDWQNIAQHAMRGFERLGLSGKSLTSLVDLLKKSPHFSVHIHVFERLRGADRPDVAQAILPFLADPRFRVREAAEAALRQMPSAIERLFDVLMRSDDLEVTQRVNSILRDFPQRTRGKYVDPASAKLMRLFERNDPHYTAFLDFIRAVDPEPLRKRIYKRAKSLKAGKSREKWPKITSYLQLLWDNHLITPEGRYLFAVALLRQGQRDLAPASRRADLGLRVIRALIYDDSERLIQKLIKDRDLRPEDYFYLGFHFAEEGEEVSQFGVAMLQHVVDKFPKTKVGGPALHKLQLQLSGNAEKDQAAARKSPRKAAARAKAKSRLALRQEGSQAAARTKRAARKTDVKKSAAPTAGSSATVKKAAKEKTAKKPTTKKKSSGKKPASTRKTAKKATGKAKKKPAKASGSAKRAVKKTAKGRKKSKKTRR